MPGLQSPDPPLHTETAGFQPATRHNWCEGAMRPIALGRKNWFHLGDETAGLKIAAIISIVETCRRLDIKLREYLGEVLPKLGTWPTTQVAELTPTAWNGARRR